MRDRSVVTGGRTTTIAEWVPDPDESASDKDTDHGPANGHARGAAAKGKRPRRSRLVAALADEIRAFSKLPRLSWGLEELDRLAPFPVGSMVVVVGATGRGKSSFVLQAGRHHARTIGPVLVVSAELVGAIAGARLVSSLVGAPWWRVLAGDVDAELERALDLPNMRLLDEVGPDILAVIDAELEFFAAEHPGQPALVVLDYLQLLPGASQEMRHRVSDNAVALRKLMVKHRAGAMVVAKAGRAAARELRRGESIGSDTTEAGAETGAIEHEATALIALGAMRPANEADPDGPGIIDVSIAKSRFGIADKVVPHKADLSIGRFEQHGSAVSASERRAEAKVLADSAKVETLMRAVRDLVTSSPRPLSQKDVCTAVSGRDADIIAAIKKLARAETPEIVQVVAAGIKRKGGHVPWWTAARAAEAGLTIVPNAVADHD